VPLLEQIVLVRRTTAASLLSGSESPAALPWFLLQLPVALHLLNEAEGYGLEQPNFPLQEVLPQQVTALRALLVQLFDVVVQLGQLGLLLLRIVLDRHLRLGQQGLLRLFAGLDHLLLRQDLRGVDAVSSSGGNGGEVNGRV
jgi:hypothetical protein